MDAQEIRRWHSVFKRDDELFEIRILGDRTWSGYFYDVEVAIKALEHFGDCNTYYTINEVKKACASREQFNCFKQVKGTATSKTDIEHRWWLAKPNGWLTKGLEGKVHLENPQAYSSIMLGKDAPYTPICDGALSWNDYYSSFIFVGFWDGKHIPDGYDDDTRPDGASVTLNNGRGTLVWNAETKTWIKQ